MGRKHYTLHYYQYNHPRRRKWQWVWKALWILLGIATLGMLPATVWLAKATVKWMKGLGDPSNYRNRKIGDEKWVVVGIAIFIMVVCYVSLVVGASQSSQNGAQAASPGAAIGALVVSSLLLGVPLAVIGYLGLKRWDKTMQLRVEAEDEFRRRWLASPPTSFRNEIEVEVKFIYPLLRFLGFKDDDLNVRERVNVRVGHQIVNGQADWVVRRDGKPFVVVEAKEPRVTLGEDVREQAQSYAFALRAPYYLLTNGREVKLYQRGVDEDVMVVHCHAERLRGCWLQLMEHLAKG